MPIQKKVSVYPMNDGSFRVGIPLTESNGDGKVPLGCGYILHPQEVKRQNQDAMTVIRRLYPTAIKHDLLLVDLNQVIRSKITTLDLLFD